MNIGIPCDCLGSNSKYRGKYPFPNFLKIIDGNVVGLIVPESVKKNTELYNLALQEFSDWYYYGCPHYGHFLAHTNNIRFYPETITLKFVASRREIPLLYMIFIDALKPSSYFEPKVYIPYNQLDNLIDEIEFSLNRMDQVTIPCLCKMEPFEYSYPYENICMSDKNLFYEFFPCIFLNDTITFLMYDSYQLPQSLFNEYRQIFAHQNFIPRSEKILITKHFFTLKLKSAPGWTRVIDIPTGRFMDFPDNKFLLSHECSGENDICTEFKVLPKPFSSKSFFENHFKYLMSLINKAKKHKKPIIGIDYMCDFIKRDRFADEDDYE